MSIRQRNAHFTDWAAVCRALNVATESEARTALESSDNPFYYYVCYIKSTKEIYTHGQFYNGSEREDLLHLIQTLAEEVTENEEVTARTLAELSENKASRGAVEMLDLCKQDKIDDLDAIRDGAAKGATALQSYTEQYKGTVTSVKIDNVSYSTRSGLVDLGYINKNLTTSTAPSMSLSPNVYYRNTSTWLSTLTITLGKVSNSNIINEYFVEFTTSSSGTTVNLPSTIKWANGETPTFEASTTYQISIVNNLGVVTKFK